MVVFLEEATVHPSFRADGREVVQYTYRIAPSAQGLAQFVYQSLSPDERNKMEGLKRYNEMPLKILLDYVHTKWPSLKT